MIDVLKGGSDGEQKEAVDKLNNHLDGFARSGLRTLVMGKRVLTQQEFEEWSNEYDAARTSVSDRDEKLMECACSIEKDITLIGASAIEDKLQEGVPEAIKALRAAGIAVWVLTGDKAETAKNIGISCQVSGTTESCINEYAQYFQSVDLPAFSYFNLTMYCSHH